MEKLSQNDDSVNLVQTKPRSAYSVWSRKALIARLAKGPEARHKFVESQIVNEIAFQLRALRHKNGWSQPMLAKELGTTQNQVYRLENTGTSKPTISTLKKIAAVFDVGLVVRFVPFGEMIDYLSGTPRWDTGISTSRKRPPSFQEEFSSVDNQTSAVTANLSFKLREQRHTGEIPLSPKRTAISRDVARITPKVIPFPSAA